MPRLTLLALAFSVLAVVPAHAMTVRYTNAATQALTVEQRATIEKIANSAENEARQQLPDLTRDIILIVDSGRNVLAESGELGVATSPTLIRWTLDARRPEGPMAIVNAHLRTMVLHETHHLVRGWLASGVEPAASHWDGIIAEGLASAFARDITGTTPPWANYPPEVTSWIGELQMLSDEQVQTRFTQWMGDLPDGRRFAGYKIGTYIVDLARKNSGRTHAQLVTLPAFQILQLAGY
jgi:hypothetical protein